MFEYKSNLGNILPFDCVIPLLGTKVTIDCMSANVGSLLLVVTSSPL